MRWRAALPSIFGALLAVASGGCSLLFVASDYTGGGGTAGDAAPSSADAQTSDAAGAADAGRPGDGGTTPDGPFCANRSPAPMFCLDFDTSPTFDDRSAFQSINGWTTGGISELDHASFFSPSSSLHLSAPGGVPGTADGITNRLGYDFPVAPVTSAHVECKLRIDADDAQRLAYAVWMNFGNSTQLMVYTSRADAGLMTVYPSGTTTAYVSKHFPAPFPIGTWLHVEVDVSFSAAPARVTVKVDGARVLDDVALDPAYVAGGGQVSLGPAIYTNATVTGTSFHFDDFLVDYR